MITISFQKFFFCLAFVGEFTVLLCWNFVGDICFGDGWDFHLNCSVINLSVFPHAGLNVCFSRISEQLGAFVG